MDQLIFSAFLAPDVIGPIVNTEALPEEETFAHNPTYEAEMIKKGPST